MSCADTWVPSKRPSALSLMVTSASSSTRAASVAICSEATSPTSSVAVIKASTTSGTRSGTISSLHTFSFKIALESAVCLSGSSPWNCSMISFSERTALPMISALPLMYPRTTRSIFSPDDHPFSSPSTMKAILMLGGALATNLAAMPESTGVEILSTSGRPSMETSTWMSERPATPPAGRRPRTPVIVTWMLCLAMGEPFALYAGAVEEAVEASEACAPPTHPPEDDDEEPLNGPSAFAAVAPTGAAVAPPSKDGCCPGVARGSVTCTEVLLEVQPMAPTTSCLETGGQAEKQQLA
mmetsp:Transcript_147149/g.472670  ORF Transcript_147149/g.472670 Transcript_147149/m.472670 type:complete len:297 (+) Transcript_147149:264-1154(+)